MLAEDGGWMEQTEKAASAGDGNLARGHTGQIGSTKELVSVKRLVYH